MLGQAMVTIAAASLLSSKHGSRERKTDADQLDRITSDFFEAAIRSSENRSFAMIKVQAQAALVGIEAEGAPYLVDKCIGWGDAPPNPDVSKQMWFDRPAISGNMYHVSGSYKAGFKIEDYAAPFTPLKGPAICEPGPLWTKGDAAGQRAHLGLLQSIMDDKSNRWKPINQIVETVDPLIGDIASAIRQLRALARTLLEV